MGKNHLSRLASPKTWNVKRKTTKWIARPSSGPHPLSKSFSLNFFLREIVGYAKTTKEIKKVLSSSNVLVDGVARKDYKFPVGLMDVIQIPTLKENYRIIFNKKGKFAVVSIDAKEAGFKLLKLIGKKVLSKEKLQLNFHDGKNLLVGKFDGRVGDTILFDLKKKILDKIIPLEKGSLVYLSGGSHVGCLGVVKDVVRAKDLQKPKVVVEVEGKEYVTVAEYAFVVGKTKPEISLGVKE